MTDKTMDERLDEAGRVVARLLSRLAELEARVAAIEGKDLSAEWFRKAFDLLDSRVSDLERVVPDTYALEETQKARDPDPGGTPGDGVPRRPG